MATSLSALLCIVVRAGMVFLVVASSTIRPSPSYEHGGPGFGGGSILCARAFSASLPSVVGEGVRRRRKWRRVFGADVGGSNGGGGSIGSGTGTVARARLATASERRRLAPVPMSRSTSARGGGVRAEATWATWTTWTTWTTLPPKYALATSSSSSDDGEDASSDRDHLSADTNATTTSFSSVSLSSSASTTSSATATSVTYPPALDVDGTLSSWSRLLSSLPPISRRINLDGTPSSWRLKLGDDLDRRILTTAIPSMINLAVVPLVNAVDTFWVGRMGSALALAGQAAANQAFFTVYFLVAFLPTITAPLVATAVGSGDDDAAMDRVCESLFLSNLLGGLGTLLLVGFPSFGLGMVLSPNAPARETARPYLRLRALSMVPALFSATGFAAYRGLLDTITPLKVSLATNLLNLIADPFFIFGVPDLFRPVLRKVTDNAGSLSGLGMGVAGAALATAVSELASGLVYLKLLLQRGLVRWSKLARPPKWEKLMPLLKGGMAMLARQATLNVAFLSAARRAQAMDPSGVAAAAYGIVMQIYSVGVVAHLAVQGTAAALIPSARSASGDDAARDVADRIFFWGTLVGTALAILQLSLLPILVPIFSTLPDVRQATNMPAAISAMIHIINGPVFAGEGAMLGLGSYGALAVVTCVGVGTMVACLSTPMGRGLNGILLSLAAFCAVQAIGVVLHHVRIGPLRRRGLSWRMQR